MFCGFVLKFINLVIWEMMKICKEIVVRGLGEVFYLKRCVRDGFFVRREVLGGGGFVKVNR